MTHEEKETALDIENSRKESRLQAPKYTNAYFLQMNALACRIVETFEEEQFIHDGARVLDIGCGLGRLLTRIANRWKKCCIVGVDRSLTDALLAKKRARDLNMENPDAIHIVVADANALPFKENRFDFVFSHSTLEHIPTPRPVASESLRVLKERRPLYITVANALRVDKWGDLQKPTFYSILTPYEFKKLFPHFEKSFITLHGFVEKSGHPIGMLLRKWLKTFSVAPFFAPELALIVRKQKKVATISLYGFMSFMADILSVLFLPFLYFQRKKIKTNTGYPWLQGLQAVLLLFLRRLS